MEMENYFLEKDLLRFKSPPPWKPDRVKTLELLIEETTDFVFNIERCERSIPSVMDEGTVVQQCIEGSYDEKRAKSWVFLHLYRHAVCQANAIGILIEKSAFRGVLPLWRSLFEACVLCVWFAERYSENPRLFQDYICHSLLRSWYMHLDKRNKMHMASDRETHIDASEIDAMKSALICRFKSTLAYSWAYPILKKRPTFLDLMEDVADAEDKSLYRLSNQEIHPTIGNKFVLNDICLPLQVFPRSFTGTTCTLDYATAKTLSQITARVDDFLILKEPAQEQLGSLILLGDNVVEKLKIGEC